ncbi:MAG: M20/M25/M40 family metallo-hydrolase [Pirellulales bacterium]|nr:M20/M25/M40 family metallo-hydrolase [Pirellulales bacterium]
MAFLKKSEALLMDLLAIPGVSGREGPVMQYLRKKLLAAGADPRALRFDDAHRRSPRGGQVGNLILRLPGTQPGPRRLLSAHVDTVPACLGARPVRRKNFLVPADKHTALGADDRSGTAVLLTTALTILEERLPHPPLTFLWTVQEEVGLYGSRYARVALLGRPQLAFNFDGGSADKVTCGATGGYRMTIRIHGRASHAGVTPERGVSAVVIAARAVARLDEEGWHGKIVRGDHTGTSNVGAIRGGDATNVVTPLVEVQAEARSHDPRFRCRIIRAIETAFQQAARKVKNARGKSGKVQIAGRLDYEAYRLREDDPSVQAAESAIRRRGGRPQRAISNGGLDANWLTVRGIPTVSLGGGQQNPHTTTERLDLLEFHKGCQTALWLATGCEKAK